ncbi:unnamed protein product [Chondrus crispus]|uniref:Uncharacterized protein n=1 Tax=Chondrus crispus TaxID=2769 RepID=R7QPB6_CHOCR|nr:unnamed protein product [Chondrus crispus]CDF40337.1 unnamed protein product [Chondrus crispus]|eukprot:XP_005710631.1 unnamed protein product [Chondrus crispus]
MEFVSRQLHIPTDVLRELPRTARAQRELEAFTQRLQRFNVARPPPRTAGGRAGTGSVPQSPVDRRYTEPRPPETDPAGYVRRAYGFDDGRLPEMGDLNLPAAVPSHVQGPGLAHAVHARLSAMQPVVGLPPGMGMQPVMSGLQPGYPQYQQQQPAAYMGVYGGVPTAGYQTAPAAYQGAPMGGYPGAAPAPPIQAAYMHPQQHGTATASMDTRGSYVTQPRY